MKLVAPFSISSAIAVLISSLVVDWKLRVRPM